MRPALKSWPGALNTVEAIILILFLLTQILPDHVEHNRLGGGAHSNNFPADVFLGAAHAMGRISAMSIFPRSYRKKRSGYACALSSGIWFSAWRWRRLRPMRPWAEPVALHPEQAGTPKQLIARIVQQNLRPVLMAWFGTPRIKDAWPGTAGCGLAPELIEIRVCAWLSRRRTKKLALLGPATGPRSASDSAPGRQARRSSLHPFWRAGPKGTDRSS